MRSFFRHLLAVIFILLLPIAALLTVPKLNGFSIEKIKTNWQQAGLYSTLSNGIQTQLGSESAGQDEFGQIGQLVKGELTATYLQTKIESLLDQTSAWAMDDTQPAPTLSFNDLQQKLAAENPVSKQQLDELLGQLKVEQLQDGQLPQVTDDPESQEALQQVLQSSQNLEKLASGDWTISLKEPLVGLPLAMNYYQIGLPVMLGLLVLSLLGVLLLGSSLAGKLRYTGWTLVIAGVWNAVLSGVYGVVFLGETISRMIPANGWIGEVVKIVMVSLQKVLFANFLTIEMILSGTLLLIGVALLIAAKVIRSKSTPSVSATPSAPIVDASADAPALTDPTTPPQLPA